MRSLTISTRSDSQTVEDLYIEFNLVLICNERVLPCDNQKSMKNSLIIYTILKVIIVCQEKNDKIRQKNQRKVKRVILYPFLS